MTFRDRLLATLRAAAPVLDEPGVLVVGSQVPNLLEPDAASTLVVSRDVDLAVPVSAHAAVKRRLRSVTALHPSRDEPSVWAPSSDDLLELNFVGVDPELRDPGEAYVFEDADLPLLVFGALALLGPGPPHIIDGVAVPLPRPAGLLIEKLVTDRTADKGERDLLVALGLLLVASDDDLLEMERQYRDLAADVRHAVRSNLTVLSLLPPRDGMPDPRPHRARLATLLGRLERAVTDR